MPICPSRARSAWNSTALRWSIVRSEGEVYALDEFCTHEEVSLVDGEIYDHTVECWLHGSCFDLRSGKPTGPPATKPLSTYQVRIDGDDVYVAVSE